MFWIEYTYPKSANAQYVTATLYHGSNEPRKLAAVRVPFGLGTFGLVDESLAEAKLAKKLGYKDVAWFCQVHRL